MDVLGGWNLHQSEANPRLPNISRNKVLVYLPPFGQNLKSEIMPPPNPQFDSLRLVVRVDLWGRKW